MSDLAQRLIDVAQTEIDTFIDPESTPLDREKAAEAAVVAVLRELIERPRHGGPHMYCRSEGELRGLADEIEEQQS